jgi:hypothetical protein
MTSRDIPSLLAILACVLAATVLTWWLSMKATEYILPSWGCRLRATRLQEPEEMAANLLAIARKLPRGPDRSKILQEIGRFRSQIVSLQGALASRPALRGLKAKGK